MSRASTTALWALALIALRPVLSLEPCATTAGVQYTDKIISSGPGSSASDCCESCKNTPSCVAFSFDVFSQDNTCSLHSAGAKSTPSTEFISGSASSGPAPSAPPSPHHAPSPAPSIPPSPGSVPAPHHSPAPAGPPGPPLPTSFFDVPGVSYAGVDNSVFARGFDAVGAEFKAPVVQFTSRAEPERLWAPPQYSGLDVVQVPDQVSVFTLPANQYEARGAYMFSYSEVELFANSSSTSVVSALLYESFATSFYEYFKYLLGVNSSVADYSEQHISLFKAALWSPATLRAEMSRGGSQNSSAFALQQSKLPLSRNSVEDSAAYTAFVGAFGTHYVSSAVFGGSVNVWVSASQSYAENSTISDYYVDAEKALDLLFFKFGRVSEDSTNASSLSKAFTKNASMLVEILGGDPTAVSGNFSQWAPGVYLAPVPINVTYTSLAELIPHPTRRRLLQDAIDEYIASATPKQQDARRTYSGSQTNVSSRYYPRCLAPAGRRVPFDELEPDSASEPTCNLEQGHQFGGTMVGSTTAASPGECCQQCRRSSKCAFFDFDTLSNSCRQLSTKTSDTVALMHVGGAVTSAPPAPSPAAPPSPSTHPSPSTPPVPAPKPSPAPSLPTLPTLRDPSAVAVGRFFDPGSGLTRGSCLENATFSQGTSWVDPAGPEPVRYAIPDGFSLAVPSSSCVRASKRVIQSAADVVDQHLLSTRVFAYLGLTNPADVGITTSAGLFAAQQQNASAASKNFTVGLVMLEVSLATHVLRFDLADSAAHLNSGFTSALKTLDPSSNDTQAFSRLVQQFGSTYVAEQEFGGYCRFSASYDISKAAGLSQSQIQQMGLKRVATDILSKLGVSFDMDSDITAAVSKPAASQSFYNGLTSAFSCQGGDTSILTSLTEHEPTRGVDSVPPFQRWLDSLWTFPATKGTSWTPINHGIRLRGLSDAASAGDHQLLWLATLHDLAVAGSELQSNIAASVVERDGQYKASSAAAATRPDKARTGGSGSVVSTVPGVCNGAGDVGIGCGYDATRLELFGTTIDPKKPVMQLPQCAARCYANPPPTTDPACTYCTYQNPSSDVLYRVPANVYVADAPIAGGCYEVSSHRDYESYSSAISSHYDFNSRHTSQTKTTKKIMQRFFERDDSASLMYKYLIWHSVELVDLAAAPTYDFLMATLALPQAYDSAVYRSFIDEFGTHVMTKAYMGGAALLTTYFHKCFLEMYDSEYVQEETRSHFWFHYSDSSKYHNSSVNLTRWDEWSQTELVLVGGDAWAHGELEPQPQRPAGANATQDDFPKVSTLNATDVAQWEKSISGDKVVPLAAELLVLHDFMAGWADPTVVANVNRTISEYYTSVEREMASIAQDLVPKDPHTNPSWCKPPVVVSKQSSRGPAVPKTLGGQPIGCPALPSSLSKDVAAVYAQRTGVRATL